MSRPSEPDLALRIAGLSPAKRELLERRLRERGERAVAAESIARRVNRAEAPLSFPQQRLWFLDQLEPGSILYNVTRSVRLRGRLDVEALRRSLEGLVERHEVFRTTFAVVEGEPRQRIAERGSIPLPVTDLSSLSPAEREEAAARVARREEQTPFDLAGGPLLRAQLLRMSEDEHVLVLANHHIVSDAWSAGILFRELGALYGASAGGVASPLPPLSIQYADFAQWQRGADHGQVLSRQLSYWKARLEGAPHVLDLPADRPRPPVQGFRGARETLTLSASTTAALSAFSQKEGLTLFMSLFAAFNALLSRFTGSEDIVVGSPIAGRTRPEMEGLIGCFLNTLVLRTDVSGDPSFRELTRRVREVALDAFSHADIPFEKLVEELNPDRSLSHTPLFQVMFMLQNAPVSDLDMEGLEVEPLPFALSTAKFDLTLSLSPAADGMRARAEYDVDLFDGPTIARWLRHFEALLEAALLDPDAPISTLRLLTPDEEHTILFDWNATDAPLPPEGPLSRMFEAQAARTPDAIAAVFESEQMTYGELNARANVIARRLQALGLGRGSLVAISLDRSLAMLASLLGILKAGAAYLPLDPDYPRDRIDFMIGDAPVSGLLTSRNLVGRFGAFAGPVLFAGEEDPAGVPTLSGENLPDTPGPEDRAYLIYTSGSTGRPKGVAIPHRALANLIGSMRERPGLSRTDVLLSVTTLSFDIAALELYLPLVTGARLVLVSREVAADAPRLLERIARHRVTTMQATPATWQLLLQGGWQGGAPGRIFCGGEALSRDLARDLSSRCRELWNFYGPTETTIWSAMHPIGKHIPGASAPIGRPIANTRMYVLDPAARPAPIGIPGELFIGGAGVALGYWNRPELTAEKFVPDPFRGGSECLYRTGDLARHAADGTLEFLGRLDGQVKLRGFRIEPGEIESVLLQHGGVREAAVILGDGPRGDKRLFAWIVPAPGERVDPEVLREFLAGKLPEYMIPSGFVSLERLPLTPNGKVDRRALANRDTPARSERAPSVAPRNETEEALATLWADVLGLESVGVEESFFDLGGHSLLATRLMSRIRERFGIDVPLRGLFERPTVAAFAGEVARSVSAPAPPSAAIARVSRERRRMKLSDLEKS